MSCLVLACALFSGAALAQETDTLAPAEAESGACSLPIVPGRLTITMPTEPTLPRCAASNTCAKATADAYNAAVMSYNKSLKVVNEAASEYADKLNKFTRDAGRYASCELDRINATVTQ